VSEAVELLDSLTKQGVVLWSEGSRLRYRASNGKLTPEIRAQLTSQKDAVLRAWCERAAETIVSYPATHAQRASWFLLQPKPESGAYNIVFSVRVRSTIDAAALYRSFQALMDRHPSLRRLRADPRGVLRQEQEDAGEHLGRGYRTRTARVPDRDRGGRRPLGLLPRVGGRLI